MLSEKILRHPILVTMVFALLGIMGIFTLSNTAISLMPDVDMPYLMVSSTYTNAGPESVEKSVTVPVENSLASLSNLKSISSTSREGRSVVSLEFNYGTNLDLAVDDVRTKLDRVKNSLPDGVSPTIMKMDSNSMPILRIAVRGNRSLEDLKRITEDQILDVLEQADGVGEASTMGGRTSIVRVELEQNRLQAYNLTLTSVSSKLSQQNIELGGGSITEGTLDYSIRTVGEYNSIEEINDTVITTKNGYDVRLSDIGRAYLGFQDASSVVYINGTPGLYVSITKQSGENSVHVANEVYKKIEQLEKSLPSDISLEIIRDDTISIRETIKTLLDSAWQGLVLAVIILFIFLCSIKTTVIIAISIPLSIVITMLCMNFAGITLNMMTMTGLILGVGMIVDASVVMIDNIYAYRMRGTKAKVAAVLGTQEMISSVISGNLTTIVVFVPFLIFMNNLEWVGLMAKDLIYTIVSAIVSSLFVAIFLVPVLAGVVLPLRNPKENPVRNNFLVFLYKIFDKGFDGIKWIYSKLLKSALKHKVVTLGTAVILLLGSFGLVTVLNIEAFPESEGQSVTLNVTLPAGTSLEKTRNIVRAFEKYALEEVRGYTTIFSSVGSSDGEEMIMATNCGSLSVFLPPASKQEDTPSVIKRKLMNHFDEFPGCQLVFMSDSMESFTGSDLDITLKGPELEMVRNVSNDIISVLQKNPELMNVKMDLKTGLPQIEIEIDRKRANALGVSVEAAAMEINSCISGVTATKYRTKGNEYNVIVSLQNKDKENVLDLDKIIVQGINGPVVLSNFAHLKKNYGPVSIKHENSSRTVHITASYKSNDNAFDMESKIKNDIRQNCIIPSDVIVDFGGSSKMMKEKGFVFVKIIVLAVLMVFGVMASMYGSLKKPFINMLTIPFLFIGVILIHVLTGQSLSIMSLLGLVMLVGIVVNNGIILVDYTGLLIARGDSVEKACFEAGVSRLRPVLMTTLTTVLGMLPMCFSKTGSASLVQPIGMCVVGGLLSSTFVTLVIIPVIYSIMCRKEK